MQVLAALLSTGGALTAVGIIARQLRIGFRDRGDRKLARYVFDQTRSTNGLEGYARVVEARKWSPPGVRQESRSEDVCP